MHAKYGIRYVDDILKYISFYGITVFWSKYHKILLVSILA